MDEKHPETSSPDNNAANIEKCSNEPLSTELTEATDENQAPTNITDEKINSKEPSNESEKSEVSTENIHYEGSVAIHTDPKTGYQYEWNTAKNEWVPRNTLSYGFENDTHTYTDADGVKYFWDIEKQAWFPKVDDDFIAQYQMSYGFVDNNIPVDDKPSTEKPTEVKKTAEKRKPSAPTWFEVDESQNNKVYVSNLPLDITEQELADFMQKCGLLMRDPATGKMKMKLYTEKDNPDQLKGDALCTYIKIESVDLALNLLDDYDLRGHKVKVERAKFQMKGNEYDPRLKPKKKKKKELEKIKRQQEKLFDWRPEKMRGERSKHEKTVIIKNLFEPSIFDKDVSLILEYQDDLREECKKCGDVRRVHIYDRHPEGVAQVTMREPEEADEVVLLLNNRWFGQRKITAETWDGKTKYKIAEQDSELTKRLDNWEQFLESGEPANNTEEKSNSNKDVTTKIE
ncbi:HIV Tat-specific factor 1 isoform X2 [Chrysoperla carnea]|uniref:HIV Tat-specific factor 1 isoform X2 n=1 Tax=Chrysoperla carnea TaxID=189513 RepID=UPI001D06C82B|nr:HIV Tat-specific factor 1 isoform X2 [Chrysoperla carnea]